MGKNVHDKERTNFLKANLEQALRAKKEGVNLAGYFVWTLTDNFEWAEGYRPTFGLVHVNFKSQERIIKDSGYWYQHFLRKINSKT
jgi:beta-glucosidase